MNHLFNALKRNNLFCISIKENNICSNCFNDYNKILFYDILISINDNILDLVRIESYIFNIIPDDKKDICIKCKNSIIQIK